MGEITKLVANRQTNASVVVAALEVHAKASAADVSALLFPEGEPKHLTVAIFSDAQGKVLATHADAIGAADRALADELGDDQPYRNARDAARAEARAALPDRQSSLSGAYGASVVQAYALDGALPTADNLLLQQARVVHTALAKGAPKAPAKKGRKLDFAALARQRAGCGNRDARDRPCPPCATTEIGACDVPNRYRRAPCRVHPHVPRRRARSRCRRPGRADGADMLHTTFTGADPAALPPHSPALSAPMRSPRQCTPSPAPSSISSTASAVT
jgi:hypothetical protein